MAVELSNLTSAYELASLDWFLSYEKNSVRSLHHVVFPKVDQRSKEWLERSFVFQ